MARKHSRPRSRNATPEVKAQGRSVSRVPVRAEPPQAHQVQYEPLSPHNDRATKTVEGQGTNPKSSARQKLRDHVVARTCRLADAMLRTSSQHIKELWKISNTELRLLSTLENEESLAIVEIARRALVDQAWVSRSVRVLESKKMVERRTDPEDSRSIRVSLSSKGRQLLEESRPYAQWSEECLLKGVDARKLKELLDQLEANTQAMLYALAHFRKKHAKDRSSQP
jgi:DNA-binding MarR family transcriptional regulator